MTLVVLPFQAYRNRQCEIEHSDASNQRMNAILVLWQIVFMRGNMAPFAFIYTVQQQNGPVC